MRKRPRLAAEVLQVADLESDLFEDLAVDGLFDAFAGFDEAGGVAAMFTIMAIVMVVASRRANRLVAERAQAADADQSRESSR